MLPHLTVGHFYADATSHGAGIIPYCATFTIFTDYMRGAIRIAALSQAGTIFVTTHDSIAVPWAKFRGATRQGAEKKTTTAEDLRDFLFEV